MKRRAAFVPAILAAVWLQSGLWAEENPATVAPPASAKTPVVNEV